MTASLPDDGAQLRAKLVHLPAVLRALGLLDDAEPEANGRRFKIRCPWHLESTPSCAIDIGPKERTLRARCFACGQGGDVLALVAAVHGLDLRRDYPRILALTADLALSPSHSRREGMLGGAGTGLEEVVEAGSPLSPQLCPKDFARGAEALLACAPLGGSLARGLASRGVLREAQADGWGSLPPNLRSNATPEGLSSLAARPELAWLLGSDGVRHPEHRLLIPWRAPTGHIWTLQRRFAPLHGDESPSKGGKYVLPSGHHHQPPAAYPYGAQVPELAIAEEIWLVEGAIDALAVRALNAKGLLRSDHALRSLAVLGLPGLGAWGQVRDWTLARVRGRVVRVALDADQAGAEAAARIGIDCHHGGAARVTRKGPPEGCKDWADVSAHRLGLAREAT